MVTLTINGKEVTVEPGTTIIKAANQAGEFIPHYCYHPSLSVAGSCRMCLVEIVGAPRLAIACNQPVGNDMVVLTNSDKVKEAREGVMELQLSNHPLDCPVCDQAGECTLQDYSFEYGKSHTRFEEPKREQLQVVLGPNVTITRNRCILCTRCVRFMDEIAQEPLLSVEHRGAKNQITIAEGHELNHPLAGNVVDVCPVGSLLDRNFTHRTRPWKLKKSSSICGECSVGCNTRIDHYKDEIFRIKPRPNKDVNGYFICDTGRYAYRVYNQITRITQPLKKTGDSFEPTSWQDAYKNISANFSQLKKSKNAIAGIVAPSSSNEDAFAVKWLLKKVYGSDVVAGVPAIVDGKDTTYGGGFRINAEKAPNQNGVKLILGNLADDTFIKNVSSVKAAYVVHNEATDISKELIAALKKVEFLVVEAVAESELTRIADYVLPGKLYLEKNGSFVNYQNRLQVFEKGPSAPAGTRFTWEIAQDLAAMSKESKGWTSANDVFQHMEKNITEFEGLSHFKIGKSGKVLTKGTPVVEPVGK